VAAAEDAVSRAQDVAAGVVIHPAAYIFENEHFSLRLEMVKEEARGSRDKLYAHAGFVSCGLSGMRPIGLDHLPETPEHITAVSIR